MKHALSLAGKGFLIFLGLALVITAALFLADAVADNTALQQTVASLGYGGVVLLAIIAGLNVVLPIPPGSFTPTFVAAGLWLPFIIIALTIGTVIADFIGFWFGRLSRNAITSKYPKSLGRYEHLITKHRRWLMPAIFLYAGFFPFPNEAIILPLAVLGIRFTQMLLPLFLGNLAYHALFSYGMQNVFLWVF